MPPATIPPSKNLIFQKLKLELKLMETIRYGQKYFFADQAILDLVRFHFKYENDYIELPEFVPSRKWIQNFRKKYRCHLTPDTATAVIGNMLKNVNFNEDIKLNGHKMTESDGNGNINGENPKVGKDLRSSWSEFVKKAPKNFKNKYKTKLCYPSQKRRSTRSEYVSNVSNKPLNVNEGKSTNEEGDSSGLVQSFNKSKMINRKFRRKMQIPRPNLTKKVDIDHMDTGKSDGEKSSGYGEGSNSDPTDPGFSSDLDKPLKTSTNPAWSRLNSNHRGFKKKKRTSCGTGKKFPVNFWNRVRSLPSVSNKMEEHVIKSVEDIGTKVVLPETNSDPLQNQEEDLRLEFQDVLSMDTWESIYNDIAQIDLQSFDNEVLASIDGQLATETEGGFLRDETSDPAEVDLELEDSVPVPDVGNDLDFSFDSFDFESLAKLENILSENALIPTVAYSSNSKLSRAKPLPEPKFSEMDCGQVDSDMFDTDAVPYSCLEDEIVDNEQLDHNSPFQYAINSPESGASSHRDLLRVVNEIPTLDYPTSSKSSIAKSLPDLKFSNLDCEQLDFNMLNDEDVTNSCMEDEMVYYNEQLGHNSSPQYLTESGRSSHPDILSIADVDSKPDLEIEVDPEVIWRPWSKSLRNSVANPEIPTCINDKIVQDEQHNINSKSQDLTRSSGYVASLHPEVIKVVDSVPELGIGPTDLDTICQSSCSKCPDYRIVQDDQLAVDSFSNSIETEASSHPDLLRIVDSIPKLEMEPDSDVVWRPWFSKSLRNDRASSEITACIDYETVQDEQLNVNSISRNLTSPSESEASMHPDLLNVVDSISELRIMSDKETIYDPACAKEVTNSQSLPYILSSMDEQIVHDKQRLDGNPFLQDLTKSPVTEESSHQDLLGLFGSIPELEIILPDPDTICRPWFPKPLRNSGTSPGFPTYIDDRIVQDEQLDVNSISQDLTNPSGSEVSIHPEVIREVPDPDTIGHPLFYKSKTRLNPDILDVFKPVRGHCNKSKKLKPASLVKFDLPKSRESLEVPLDLSRTRGLDLSQYQCMDEAERNNRSTVIHTSSASPGPVDELPLDLSVTRVLDLSKSQYMVETERHDPNTLIGTPNPNENQEIVVEVPLDLSRTVNHPKRNQYMIKTDKTDDRINPGSISSASSPSLENEYQGKVNIERAPERVPQWEENNNRDRPSCQHMIGTEKTSIMPTVMSSPSMVAQIAVVHVAEVVNRRIVKGKTGLTLTKRFLRI